MRIFFVCLRVPYPPDRGDKIATFNEVRHLSQQHELHIFCLAGDAGDADNVRALGKFAKIVTAVPLSPLLGKLRVGRALITGEPLSVAILGEKKLYDAVRERCAALPPDLFLIYSGNMAQFAEDFPDIPRIMQFSDLDSLKWRQYAERTTIPMKWLYRVEGRRLLEYERRIARSFSHSLVCTDIEKADFERLIPGAIVSRVGNGVDLDFFRSQGAAKQPGAMIFTGVMDYLPNVDGVLWFCEEVLPGVRELVPAAHLVICGRRPSAAVLALAKRPGVKVTGQVSDVRPFFDAAELAVVPLRMARGIQNKLLEAMAMGLPCVTSTLAWRGTSIPPGEGVLVADEPKDFITHIVRILRDAELRGQLSRRARRAVEADYDWEAQLSRLDAVIATVVPRASP